MVRLDADPTDVELEKAMNEIDLNGDGNIEYDEFRKWYAISEAKIRGEMRHAFELIDANGNNQVDHDELATLLRLLGKEATDDEMEQIRKELDRDEDGIISKEEFFMWYESSVFFKTRLQDAKRDLEDEETLLPLFPEEDVSAQILYIVSLPIILVCYGTIPNLNKESWRSWYLPGFFMSIFWIGVFSFFMVWWATQFGDSFGIPSQVMGLTILAAGTSVPDLLSSVIVAQQVRLSRCFRLCFLLSLSLSCSLSLSLSLSLALFFSRAPLPIRNRVRAIWQSRPQLEVTFLTSSLDFRCPGSSGVRQTGHKE